MGKFYTKISSRLQKFIAAQKVFFVATAPKNGRINLSPKGMDSFRIVNENRVLWLSVTGSGNETAAHLLENGRITIMFCAFDGAPNIVRIYGKGKEIKPSDSNWNEVISLFPKMSGTRQIFDIAVENVGTSCGMGIPIMKYTKEREELIDWADNLGSDGIENYWKEKNTNSIDGLPTNILE